MHTALYYLYVKSKLILKFVLPLEDGKRLVNKNTRWIGILLVVDDPE